MEDSEGKTEDDLGNKIKDENLLNERTLQEIHRIVSENVEKSQKKLPGAVRLLNAILNAVLAKVLIKLVILFFGGILVLAPFCVTQVKDYELVMIHRWGKLIETPVEPGLRWFWPIMDKVHRFDLRQKNIIISDENDHKRRIEGIDFESRDKYHAGFIASIHYTLDREKGKKLVDTYGAQDSKDVRKAIETRIEDEIRYALQNLGPQYDLEDIIRNRSAFINNALFILGFKPSSQEKVVKRTLEQNTEHEEEAVSYMISIPGPMRIKERLTDLGIILEYIRLEIHTPESYESKNRVELSLLELEDLEKNEIKRAEIKSKSMQALESSALIYFLEKWDGKLPESLVLDSDFFEELKKDKTVRRIK